jgi:hypothetical protein
VGSSISSWAGASAILDDTRLGHERNEKDEDVPGEDDFLRESPANIVERARQFMTIKELLTATALGTS